MIWKLRLKPRRWISNGRKPVTFSPFSSMVPELTGNRALIRLNKVDLPAPFGPMMA